MWNITTQFNSVVSRRMRCLVVISSLALVLVFAGVAGAWHAYIDGDMDGDPNTVGDYIFGPETTTADLVVVLDEQDVAELEIEFYLELEWDCVDQPEIPYPCTEYHGAATPLNFTCDTLYASVVWDQCALIGCGCSARYYISVYIYNPYMEHLGRRIITPGAYCLEQVEFTRVGRDCGEEDVPFDGGPLTYERTEFRLWNANHEFEALFVMEGEAVSTEATTWSNIKAIYSGDR